MLGTLLVRLFKFSQEYLLRLHEGHGKEGHKIDPGGGRRLQTKYRNPVFLAFMSEWY